MQEMQSGQGGVWGPPAQDTINIYGRSTISHHQPAPSTHDSGVYGDYGFDQAGPRQNVASTAWGAMSDNVWGTFNDNVWGTSTDTVWGTNTSDVWGGIGGNPWGNFAKTHRIWGSGDGHNYLKGLAERVAAFFGLHFQSQANRAALHTTMEEHTRNSRNSSVEHGQTTRASSEHTQTTRAAAPVEHVVTRAPVNTSTRK
jgi:hypothetical protein